MYNECASGDCMKDYRFLEYYRHDKTTEKVSLTLHLSIRVVGEQSKRVVSELNLVRSEGESMLCLLSKADNDLI